MMAQHQTKSDCFNHCATTAGILVLQKSKSTQSTQVYTDKRRRSNVAFMMGRRCIGWTNYSTTQVDCIYWA